MKNAYLDSIVTAVLKYKHKMISIDVIRRVFASVMQDAYTDKKMYKLLYYLKNRGYLLTLKKNVYFVKLVDEEYSEDWLIERFYRDLVKKHCKDYVQGDWYIAGLKALELHLSAYDIPDEIVLVNTHKQSTEVVMFDKKVLFKTYISGGNNLFRLYKKYVQKVDIGRMTVPVICMEIALLETLYNPSVVHKGYVEGLVKKLLKKYKNILNPDIWASVVRNNKHHSSLNRLYILAQQIDKKLAANIFSVIRKYSYVLE